jgi:amino acid adenylation domain-containing protein/non-ribosomal peptide synthase protein (TIGR01720 family)
MVDPSSPRERRARMVAAVGAQVVVTAGELAGALADAGRVVITLDDDAETVATEPAAEPGDPGIADDRLAYMVFTSGSTGAPKAVCVSHRNLAEYTTGVQDVLRLPPGACSGLVSSMAVDLGYTSVFPALCSGGAVHVVPEECVTDPLELARYFRRFPVDCLKITPSHLRASLEGGDPAGILPSRVLLIGGEPLDWDLVERIREAAPACRVVNHYGPAETTVGVLACETGADEGAGSRGPVPLGWEFGRTRVYLLDEWLRPVPVWVQGEIYVGGAAVSRGYARLPGATAERFVADPFGPAGGRLYRTGDRARRLPDGALVFEGRTDDQLKVRGFRVEPAEVAAVLRGHPSVREAVVLGCKDGTGVVRLVAYGVWETTAERELRDFCARQMPSYMVPSVFTAVEKLPMTAGGKVDRRALPAPVFDAGNGAAFEEPRGPVEELLAGVWAQALGLPRVGRRDDFFALGGDSIVSIQVVARAAQLGLRLTPRMLFRYRTVAGVVPEVRATSGGAIAEQGAVRGPVPMTPIVRWFVEQEQPLVRHYNQAVWLRMPGGIDEQALRATLRELVAHHDGLRLRLITDASGEWVVENAGPDAAERADPLLSVVDCSGLAPDEWDQRLSELAAGVQVSVDVESGCLLCGALVRLPGEDRLLLAVHHLGIDGVSWRILLEDLTAGYRQALDGSALRFPAKSTSFRAWARRLQAYAQSPELLAEVGYWKAAAGGPGLTVPPDAGGDLSRNTHGVAATVTGGLDRAETDALLRPRSAVATLDLLLGALGRTLADWTGQQRVVLDLEGHGRESPWDDVDVSRTVGWFTCQYPLALDVSPGQDVRDVARRAHEALASVPQGGLGYGLLRYGRHGGEGQAATLRGLAHPQARFNYLGQVAATEPGQLMSSTAASGAVFTLSQGGTGPTADPRARRPYLLDITAIVVDGRLQVSWTYCPELHRGSTVESLATGLLARLRELCAENARSGGLRPEDFPLASLDRAQLAAIEAVLED